MLKRSFVTVASSLLLSAMLPNVSAQGAEMKKAPKIVIKGIDIPNLDTAKLDGKVTIVNFWATWCNACKEELKEMGEIFKPLRETGGVRLAFVSVDKDPVKAKEWMKANKKAIGSDFTKYLYQDPEFKAAEAFSVENFPLTVVIDANGKIMHIQKGFQSGSNSTKEIYAAARKLL